MEPETSNYWFNNHFDLDMGGSFCGVVQRGKKSPPSDTVSVNDLWGGPMSKGPHISRKRAGSVTVGYFIIRDNFLRSLLGEIIGLSFGYPWVLWRKNYLLFCWVFLEGRISVWVSGRQRMIFLLLFAAVIQQKSVNYVWFLRKFFVVINTRITEKLKCQYKSLNFV